MLGLGKVKKIIVIVLIVVIVVLYDIMHYAGTGQGLNTQ